MRLKNLFEKNEMHSQAAFFLSFPPPLFVDNNKNLNIISFDIKNAIVLIANLCEILLRAGGGRGVNLCLRLQSEVEDWEERERTR